MNKKLIIGIVLGGALIVGGFYFYNKNKKATELKKYFASESDALQVVDALNKRDTPYTSEQTKKFVDIYKVNVDKDLHTRILSAVNKKESDFNTEDKISSAILIDKVINKIK